MLTRGCSLERCHGWHGDGEAVPGTCMLGKAATHWNTEAKLSLQTWQSFRRVVRVLRKIPLLLEALPLNTK